jgi:hypothetical protein
MFQISFQKKKNLITGDYVMSKKQKGKTKEVGTINNLLFGPRTC